MDNSTFVRLSQNGGVLTRIRLHNIRRFTPANNQNHKQRDSIIQTPRRSHLALWLRQLCDWWCAIHYFILKCCSLLGNIIKKIPTAYHGTTIPKHPVNDANDNRLKNVFFLFRRYNCPVIIASTETVFTRRWFIVSSIVRPFVGQNYFLVL